MCEEVMLFARYINQKRFVSSTCMYYQNVCVIILSRLPTACSVNNVMIGQLFVVLCTAWM